MNEHTSFPRETAVLWGLHVELTAQVGWGLTVSFLYVLTGDTQTG